LAKDPAKHFTITRTLIGYPLATLDNVSTFPAHNEKVYVTHIHLD